MLFLFYNKVLLRVLVTLSGLGIGLAAWQYASLSALKLQQQGVRDALAIISFLIAGWLVMLIAEVVDNRYVRIFGCLCVGLGGYIAYRWIFVEDGSKLAELSAGPAGMRLVGAGYWGALGIAALMFALLVIRLALDKANYGRRPATVARMDVGLGVKPEGMGMAPEEPGLPPIPVDTSPLNVAAPASSVEAQPAAQAQRTTAPVSKMTGIGGVYLGHVFNLSPGDHSIGRSDAELLLENDKQVSRSHARVSVDAGGIATITDLGSSNGTFLNDERIESAALAPGDVVRIGTTMFKVEA